jgi:FtsZ-interacting cell division protein ZipA
MKTVLIVCGVILAVALLFAGAYYWLNKTFSSPGN